MEIESTQDLAEMAFQNCVKRTPWLLEHRSDQWFGEQIVVTDSNHCVLFRVPPSGPEQWKIARLTASAPELLAQLKRVTEELELVWDHIGQASQNVHAAKAQEIIYMAEGR